MVDAMRGKRKILYFHIFHVLFVVVVMMAICVQSFFTINNIQKKNKKKNIITDQWQPIYLYLLMS